MQVANAEQPSQAPPLFGDMPDECWTKGIAPAAKKMWDFALGTNGRGAICLGVSKFLALGVSGAKVLLMDPLSSASHWVSEARPASFWPEGKFRDQQSVTGKRMLELLKRAAGVEGSALGQYTVPGGDKRPGRMPIFSHLVRLGPAQSVGSTWRGPRIGTAAQGDAFDFYEVVVNKKKGIFLRTRDGWLAPCREVRKRKVLFGLKDAKLAGGYKQCLDQLAGNTYVKGVYEKAAGGKP